MNKVSESKIANATPEPPSGEPLQPPAPRDQQAWRSAIAQAPTSNGSANDTSLNERKIPPFGGMSLTQDTEGDHLRETPPSPVKDADTPEENTTSGQARREARHSDTSEAERAGQARREARAGGKSDAESTEHARQTERGATTTPDSGTAGVASAENEGGVDSSGTAVTNDNTEPGIDQTGEHPNTEPSPLPHSESPPSSGSGSKASEVDIRGTKGDDYHYQIQNGVETFTISDQDKPPGEQHDPRVEGTFKDHKIVAGDQKIFSGKFTVMSGNDTTIAQLLNSNSSNKGDPSKPSAFITYQNGALYEGHAGGGKKLADVTPGEEFELTMETDGKTVDIFVNGQPVGSDDVRSGGYSYFRYGAYHHGSGEASIRARDVMVS